MVCTNYTVDWACTEIADNESKNRMHNNRFIKNLFK